MIRLTVRILAIAALTVMIGTAQAGSKTKITFWESMNGPLGEQLQALVNEFNNSQPDYEVHLVYKGTYAMSMNAGIAAFRARQPPDILQVFEVGTATMISAKGATMPVQALSEQVGNPLDPSQFLPPVAAYYSTDGKLQSMPFNSSTAVMYYNKDAFRKAGLDPNKPPKTWAGVARDAHKLRAAGMSCGYTTSWPAWILIENFAAWNNVPYATEDDGFGGPGARLLLDTPAFVKHMTFLAGMARRGDFTYGGRGDDANQLFISGKCGIYTGSSATRDAIARHGKFAFGTTELPYYPDLPGAPQNSIIGGASLWVFAGKSQQVYKGVIAFFKFLASPKVVAKWHEETGYLPVTKAGYELVRKSGFYKKHAGAQIAVEQIDVTKTTKNSQGVRLGYLPQIRDIEMSDMEKIFAGSISPKAGLEDMQTRGNALLKRFQESVQ